MKKWLKIAIMTLLMSLLFSVTAFAEDAETESHAWDDWGTPAPWDPDSDGLEGDGNWIKFGLHFLHYGVDIDSEAGQALNGFREKLFDEIQEFHVTFKDENGKEYQFAFDRNNFYRTFLEVDPGTYTITKVMWINDIIDYEDYGDIHPVDSKYLYTTQFIVKENTKQVYIYMDIPRLYLAEKDKLTSVSRPVLTQIRPFCDEVYEEDGTPKKEYNHETDNITAYESNEENRVWLDGYCVKNNLDPFTLEPLGSDTNQDTNTEEPSHSDVIVVPNPDNSEVIVVPPAENETVTEAPTTVEDEQPKGNAFLDWLKNNAFTLILIVGVLTAYIIYVVRKKNK